MNDLKQIGNYKVLNVLGAGAHGLVYRAINQSNGELCAIKHIEKDFVNPKQTQSEGFFRNELRFLKVISHPNIVRFFNFLEEANSLVIVLEFMEGGALNQVIDKIGPLSEQFTKSIISQLLKSLFYLHSKNIVHRDIKVSVLNLK
jgi:serine/threonine protein kinase